MIIDIDNCIISTLKMYNFSEFSFPTMLSTERTSPSDARHHPLSTSVACRATDRTAWQCRIHYPKW